MVPKFCLIICQLFGTHSLLKFGKLQVHVSWTAVDFHVGLNILHTRICLTICRNTHISLSLSNQYLLANTKYINLHSSLYSYSTAIYAIIYTIGIFPNVYCIDFIPVCKDTNRTIKETILGNANRYRIKKNYTRII